MPFYIGDYDAATKRLSLAEDGAYMRLIRDYWQNGAPPDDDTVLSRIVRVERREWAKLRPVLAGYFQIGDGLWTHARIEHEIGVATANVSARSKAGAAGAQARWGTNSKRNGKADGKRMANASVRQWQNDGPSPSPLPPTSEEGTTQDGTDLSEGTSATDRLAVVVGGRP